MQPPFRCLRSILLSMATELTLYMTREHSLAYAGVWNKANAELFSSYVPGTNISLMLFKLNEDGILNVYYDLAELKNAFNSIGVAISHDLSLLDRIITDFYSAWKKLFPYVIGEKRIENNEELKKYFKVWLEWWPAMAYIFVIPDLDTISGALKEKALRVRIETQTYSDEIDRVYGNFVKKYYPQLAEYWRLLSLDEALCLETLTLDDIDIIKKRKEGYALATIQDATVLGSFEELKKMCEVKGVLISTHNERSDFLQGTIAVKGKVQGRVCLILKKADLAHIKAGDILISYATSPDYVPAMKQCAAVVTDEGGVVCHAAIVCRELGIPCIVGTKSATQVFKNGDLVDVDAERGVIRRVD